MDGWKGGFEQEEDIFEHDQKYIGTQWRKHNENLVVGFVHDSHPSVVFDSEIKQNIFHSPSHPMRKRKRF
jgi:hypothetical protein